MVLLLYAFRPDENLLPFLYILIILGGNFISSDSVQDITPLFSSFRASSVSSSFCYCSLLSLLCHKGFCHRYRITLVSQSHDDRILCHCEFCWVISILH